jgi:hypothetical protein
MRIQEVRQFIQHGGILWHDVVQRVARQDFTLSIDHEHGLSPDIFAEHLRTQYVLKRRILMKRVPGLGLNARAPE